MQIEIGFFPKHYYSSKPQVGGFFPFAIDGRIEFVFDLMGFYLPESNEVFIPLWMENLNAFPIYFCTDIPYYWKDDYEQICKEYQIRYKFLAHSHQMSVAVTEVKSPEQFRVIFPVFITLGSGNDVVVWSAKKDVFSFEPREWTGEMEGAVMKTIVAKLESNMSLFWIGYDGNSIAVISNNPDFSTYEKIRNTMPAFVKTTECQYE